MLSRSRWLNYLVLRTFSNVKRKCWKCGQTNKQTALFCESCEVLQEIDTDASYFDVLEVKKTFEVNLRDVKTKYLQLQTMLHPDRFSNKTESEQILSAKYSSLINKAYNTLLHPLSRGMYMIQLEGRSIEESDIQMDSEFLLDIMEINEKLDGLKDVKEINDMEVSNREQLDKLIEDLSSAFQDGRLDDAQQLLAKMKYYANIEGKLKDINIELGIVK